MRVEGKTFALEHVAEVSPAPVAENLDLVSGFGSKSLQEMSFNIKLSGNEVYFTA